MNPFIQLKKATALIFVMLICFGLSPTMHAVVPAPDGGYANFTTAEGTNALLNLTTGAANTAVGWYALFSAGDASNNTGVGAGALALNNGISNTAVGTAALLLNTSSTENTAVGTDAMAHNDTGDDNTAAGAFALFSNTAGDFNVANGVAALYFNTTGSANVANGVGVLANNTIGAFNVANGDHALFSNTTGNTNVANGAFALYSNTTGGYNTVLGDQAGSNLTTGSGNVCIGSNVHGVAGASNTTWISNVFASVANGRAVYVNSDDKIGTLSSSRRYKEEIKPMGQASETLFGLKPVAFRYKKEVDRSQALSFGLIAEEVAEISPDLITRDKEGKPETVRYEAVNAMLLNEFLKEHREVQELKKQVAALTAGLQKVSAQLEASKPAPQVVNNP